MDEIKNDQVKFSFAIPGAIVIAGLIIAGAIYYKDGTPSRAGQVAAPGGTEDNVKLENLQPVSAEDHILGDLQAPIKIVEFSDLECPFCKDFHRTMLQVMQKYAPTGKVAWIYRHFPLDQLHSKARNEAEASECAFTLGGNDKFWAFITKVFEVTPANNGLDPAQLPIIAESVGLNKIAFTECLISGKTADIVDAQYQDAVKSGGTGTPFPIVITPDGKKIALQGAIPLEAMQQLIETLLTQKNN